MNFGFRARCQELIPKVLGCKTYATGILGVWAVWGIDSTKETSVGSTGSDFVHPAIQIETASGISELWVSPLEVEAFGIEVGSLLGSRRWASKAPWNESQGCCSLEGLTVTHAPMHLKRRCKDCLPLVCPVLLAMIC